MTLHFPAHYLQSTVSLVMQFGMSPLIISADLAPACRESFFNFKKAVLRSDRKNELCKNSYGVTTTERQIFKSGRLLPELTAMMVNIAELTAMMVNILFLKKVGCN